MRINYSKGKKHGKSFSWYPNGQIKEKSIYNKGSKIGTHLGFWPNGNIRFKKNDIDTIPTDIINFFPYTHTLIEGILTISEAIDECINENNGNKEI